MKYKFSKNQRVKIIFPSSESHINQIGTIIKIDKKKLVMSYLVRFDDGKELFFAEKELEGTKNHAREEE